MTLDELTQAIAGARERDKFAYEVISEADRGYACEDVHMLLAVIDQLLPDARRYEWLRTRAIGFELDPRNEGIVFSVPFSGVSVSLAAESIDAAIDRAIEGEKK